MTRQLRLTSSCQPAGRDSVLLPLLIGQSPSKVVVESQPLPRSEISTRAVLCSGRSQPLGSGYRGSVVSPPAGGDCSAACLGLTVTGLVRYAPHRDASPILFPPPGSPGSLQGCVSPSLDNLDVYAFPPFLSSNGWWLESEGPQSLHDSGSPSLAREGVVCRSSSLNRGFPGLLTSCQGFIGLDSSGRLLSP